jgi:predicted nucleic acid-binding protein
MLVELPRFFLDSSVILAACGSARGANSVIMKLAEIGMIEVVTIPYVFDEVERNLERKFADSSQTYRVLRSNIPWVIMTNPSAEQFIRWLQIIPLKDASVLEAAVQINPARLVTLDQKHFIRPAIVAQQTGLTIATPKQVVEDIRATLASAFR